MPWFRRCVEDAAEVTRPQTSCICEEKNIDFDLYWHFLSHFPRRHYCKTGDTTFVSAPYFFPFIPLNGNDYENKIFAFGRSFSNSWSLWC